MEDCEHKGKSSAWEVYSRSTVNFSFWWDAMWENLGLGKSSLRKVCSRASCRKLARWNLAWMLALGSFCRKAWFWWINLQSVDSKFSYPLGEEYVVIYPESYRTTIYPSPQG